MVSTWLMRGRYLRSLLITPSADNLREWVMGQFRKYIQTGQILIIVTCKHETMMGEKTDSFVVISK